MPDPRWLDAEAAADHLSLRTDVFLRLVRADKLPKPSTHLGERTQRWDRDALDMAMTGTAASASTRERVNAVAEEIKARAARRQTNARGRDNQGISVSGV